MIPVGTEAADLLKQSVERFNYAKKFWAPWHENFVRYYKIWRCLSEAVDDIEDEDEPNTFVPYVFSLVEDISAKCTERLFKMKPPCKVAPLAPGQAEQAESFSTMARSHFDGTAYQMGFVGSFKERVITGNAWEHDVWANDVSKGKRWAKVKRPKPIEAVIEIARRVIPTVVEELVEEWELVEDTHQDRVGYVTEFPTIFDILPEPGPKQYQHLHWLIEIESAVAVQDLQAKTYVDPVTKQQTPVYDLKQLLADAKGGDPKKVITPAAPENSGADYKAEAQQAVSGSMDNQSQDSNDGIDRVYLYHVYEKSGRVVTIAQGKYIIRVAQLPVARIPFRLRVYTIDPYFLYGMGAIAPIEDEVYNLNDIRNLSMANWIRIIHRMVAIDVTNLSDTKDLNQRQGGYVRFNGGNVHTSIRELTHTDVAPSMLTMESNVKGSMERASSTADFSPGVMGSKQDHDTATGLMQIASQVNIRMAALQRVDLAVFKDQMWMMEKMVSFHQFEAAAYRKYGPDGSTTLVQLNNESIYTDGKGFDFIIEYDPSFGDDLIQRQQLLEFLNLSYQHDTWCVQAGGPEVPRPDIPFIFSRVSKAFGFEDTTQVLKRPNGVMDPKQELSIIMSGGLVKVNPMENLIGHFLQHLNDRGEPGILSSLESGKISQDAVNALDKHIAETNKAIMMVMSNPGLFAQAQQQREATQAGGKGGVPATAPTA